MLNILLNILLIPLYILEAIFDDKCKSHKKNQEVTYASFNFTTKPGWNGTIKCNFFIFLQI